MSTAELVKIPFHGSEVVAVNIDGKPHVVLKPVFDAIGVDADQQIRKLKAQPWACTGVTTVQVPGAAQTRQMITADIRTFLMCLATIPVSRVKAAARPLLEAYQREIADVIEAYWAAGGAINPRASRDQLDAIVSTARGQMDVLRLADGLVDPRWLEAKVRHVAARALGEEPEVEHQDRPLTVGEYLEEKGVTGSARRSLAPSFGKSVKRLYVQHTGRDPLTADRFIDGALRPVAVYTEADRHLFDAAFTLLGMS